MDATEARIATFSGYDTTLDIVGEVENACKIHAKTKTGTMCGETRLTFLPHTPRECSGQLYFSIEGDNMSTKLL